MQVNDIEHIFVNMVQGVFFPMYNEKKQHNLLFLLIGEQVLLDVLIGEQVMMSVLY
jgi:hypothetical protein